MGKKLDKAKKRFIDIFSGDIILRKGVNHKMGFIVYIFVIFCAIITWSLYVEKMLVKVERNAKELDALKIHYRQISVDLVGIDQRTKVERMLENCHSTLKSPAEPARIITAE